MEWSGASRPRDRVRHGAHGVLRAAGLAVGAGLAVVIGLGACGPQPSELSDPREILGRAVEHLRGARSVHLDVTVDGSLAIGVILPVPAGGGGSLALAGTRFQGDFDLATARAVLRFEVPALLGLQGELRQLGAETYLSSSLTSKGWHRLRANDLPLGAATPVGWIDALTAWLDRPAAVPTRLDDAACRAGQCYVVRLVVDRAVLDDLASAVPEVTAALADAQLTLELRVSTAALQPSEMTIDIDLGDGGSVRAVVVFSAWDAAVSIAGPPASAIVDGPLLP